jgi:hypothetical protein
MGFPITGALATITSVTSSNDLNTLLVSALKVQDVTVNQDADQFETTELSGSGVSVERLAGLMSGTFDFAGFYPKSAPRLGNSGLVTYGDGYVQVVTGWKIDVDFGEIDITSMTGSAVTAKTFMPNGIYSWSGSYTAHAVNDTAASAPSAVNYAGGSATFKLTEDGASDPALGGSIVVTGVRQTIRKADKQSLEYSFQGAGAITETKGSTLVGLRRTTTGTWPAPDWDLNGDGTPDISVVLTTYTSRTITAAAFLKSLSIECQMGQPVRVSGVVRFSGSVSRA